MNFDISILVIILIKTITTKIYRSVYSQFELNDRASLYINLTSYNIQEFYPINQQVDASYFSKRLHKISLNIKGTDALMINNSQYTRYHLNEKIAFSNVNSTICYYSLVEPPVNNPYYNGISFSLDYYNESFSIMHQLKKDKKIEHMVYAFTPTISAVGYFYIGGIPNDTINNRHRNKGKCKVNGGQWGCSLTSVYFSNDNSNKQYKYVNKNKMIFQSGYRAIYAPSSFFNHMKDTFLKPFFDNKSCYVKDYYFYNCRLIECENKTEIYTSLPTYIHFTIEHYIYSFPMKHLYDIKSDMFNPTGYIRIYIVESKSKEEKDVWILVGGFIMNYISIFDYDNREVTFYSDDMKQSMIIKATSKVVSIFNMISVISLLNILMLLLKNS